MSFIRFITVIWAVEMKKSSQKTSKSKGKENTNLFVWSGDKVEMLLKVIHEYKVSFCIVSP